MTNNTAITRFASLSRFPGLIHGVSTRQGGVSSGPFASLNLGWTVGDAPENVEMNYRRLAAALGLERAHLTSTWQVHGKRMMLATETERGRSLGKADGIITDRPGVPLTQRFADCTPLLIYDPRRHAAGLAHAGWRGTVIDVAGALVRAMAESFGSRPADLVAVVGPAIGPCCYEVGQEVIDSVRAAFDDAGDLLVSPQTGNGRLHFDLWEANRRQLLRAGVGQVEAAQVCTRCHKDVYFSHRGDAGRTGRFAAVMMLKT